MSALVWFREDLRVYDNKALFYAAEKHQQLFAVYILDSMMWKSHDIADCRVSFILQGLNSLRSELEKYNIPLIFQKVIDSRKIPETIFSLMKKFSMNTLYFNRQYEVDEASRDLAVKKYLKRHALECFDYDDQVILSPENVRTQEGKYFSIFTPFKRAWIKNFENIDSGKLSPLPKIKVRNKIKLKFNQIQIPEKITGFTLKSDPILWPTGEKNATERLEKFVRHKLYNYHLTRDFPEISGTSLLSPYLAAGMISPRQCLSAALATIQSNSSNNNKGAETWINELIWREFYKHLLTAVPRLSMSRPYKLITENLPWQFNPEQWIAWQEGMTGFPIIDAGMRQLKKMGWMHNRLRMIVAMFLTKNLLFDWRLGEKYFMQHLIDGDLAANNGGWQWCASTGTDAVPYFRVFNPILQSQRYDPKGEFIRQFCPELEAFDNKSIHNPHYYNPYLAKKVNYPKPIVDLNLSRQRAIEAYRSLKEIKSE